MKEAISTNSAPKAIGPYSQAIRHNGTLYCSGQIPLKPDTMKIVDGGIKEQTHQVLTNLFEVLKAGGSDAENVLRTTVYLADMNDFADMNAVYSQYFSGSNPPARAAIQVGRLPLDVKVEISCIAAVK